MMDKEGRFGRGPTPYDALVQYLMVAWPEALEALDEVGAKLERRGPRSPVRVGVVWTTDGGIPDEISVYADLSRAEEAYHQWWAKDGVAPEDIEGEKYNRIDGMEAHFYVVDVVQGTPQFVPDLSWDVSSLVPEGELLQDTIVDWKGRYWFLATTGQIGYVDLTLASVSGGPPST